MIFDCNAYTCILPFCDFSCFHMYSCFCYAKYDHWQFRNKLYIFGYVKYHVRDDKNEMHLHFLWSPFIHGLNWGLIWKDDFSILMPAMQFVYLVHKNKTKSNMKLQLSVRSLLTSTYNNNRPIGRHFYPLKILLNPDLLFTAHFGALFYTFKTTVNCLLVLPFLVQFYTPLSWSPWI